MTRIETDTLWERVKMEPDPKHVPPPKTTSCQHVKEERPHTGGSCQGFISTARGPRPQPSSLNGHMPHELARREHKARVIQDRTV